MTLAAIVLALVAAFAWISLTVLALASRREIESRFPEYAGKIYRTSMEVWSRRGGPVRLLVLIKEQSPDPKVRAIFEMRILALLLASSSLLALFSWGLS